MDKNKDELKLIFEDIDKEEKIDVTVENIDNKDVGKKQKTKPVEVEYEAAMEDIKKIIEDKYASLKLKFTKSGGAYIIHQTPTDTWAAFRLHSPNIYKGSIKRILHDNGIIKKYPTYFRSIL
jgi:hypothetical protein